MLIKKEIKLNVIDFLLEIVCLHDIQNFFLLQFF
jgi:hypothetical protein